MASTAMSSRTKAPKKCKDFARRPERPRRPGSVGGMPRPLRVGDPGSIFHVTARGNRKQLIFLDDGDRLLFLALLGQAVARCGWFCHAYCLMGNHYHAVIETPVFNLSEGMQRLNGRYAQMFNDRRVLSGHLFQGRFHSELIATDAHLLSSIRYVVLNPVRAGLVGDAGAWEWSSYRATAGLARPPAFLAVERARRLFAEGDGRAASAFRRFVADASILATSGV
jgi:putative transposase